MSRVWPGSIRKLAGRTLTKAPIGSQFLPMFIHAVYFWLRDNLTPAERDRFAAGLRSLRGIEGVEHGYIGVPAPTDRPVIERGYSNSLVLVFPDKAAHDAYQVHPVHDRFREECGAFWTTVRIFDSVTE
jgi:hypothetical protein